MSLLKCAVVPPSAAHTATVVFLHGLGDSGYGWHPVGEMFAPRFPHIKWLFPHAPNVPVTLNGGMRMPAWYDIKSLNAGAGGEDEAGMLATVEQVNALIKSEIDNGIPASRIILGGFSQGSAMSLLTCLLSEKKLAGIVALSGYLPLNNKIAGLKTSANDDTPILMGHGSADSVVNFEWGKASAEFLKYRLKAKVDFKTYYGMEHSTSPKELEDVATFIGSALPQVSSLHADL
ncbi:Phospholipase/carboxylesterase/thioesterase [Entophlyctis helioformis]|nr:Phospholipase/carboxylesterase/thioesterase [Entophlyctis helioformis]